MDELVWIRGDTWKTTSYNGEDELVEHTSIMIEASHMPSDFRSYTFPSSRKIMSEGPFTTMIHMSSTLFYIVVSLASFHIDWFVIKLSFFNLNPFLAFYWRKLTVFSLPSYKECIINFKCHFYCLLTQECIIHLNLIYNLCHFYSISNSILIDFYPAPSSRALSLVFWVVTLGWTSYRLNNS